LFVYLDTNFCFSGEKQYLAKDSKYGQIAKIQNWKCPLCEDSLFNREKIETHHMIPVVEKATQTTLFVTQTGTLKNPVKKGLK
jgi:hypothetical protein